MGRCLQRAAEETLSQWRYCTQLNVLLFRVIVLLWQRLSRSLLLLFCAAGA